uniref:Uncharacterized protein n=1 Tax=viral metagenome TaxID=1070528 RepID=A0A6C0B124_9ZZZZ
MIVTHKPTNVVEKFAIAYSRASSQGWDGHCTVTFSRHGSTVQCITHEDYGKILISSLFVAFITLVMISLIRSICCCHK